MRGGDSLGSPPRTTLLPDYETRARSRADSETRAPETRATEPVPGGDTYVPVTSTPEQRAAAGEFFEDSKRRESKAERPRARLHGPLFSLMQYRENPKSGELLWTQEQIDAGIQTLLDAGFTLKGADIWHGLDKQLIDTGGGVMRAEGALKPLHWHGVVWVVGADLTARQISDYFTIPLAKVRLPRDLAKQEERNPHKGRGSAERAFFDFCEYLVHENARARDEEKYQYPHSAVRTWCS